GRRSRSWARRGATPASPTARRRWRASPAWCSSWPARSLDAAAHAGRLRCHAVMAPPRLSVLMPVYNELATIEQAIGEVLAADLPADAELVIVDDGSSDGTAELLDGRDWGARVRVIHHPVNQGK